MHNLSRTDAPILQSGFDRRHIVSSQTMLDHYMQVLNGKKWTQAKATLKRKSTATADPLGDPTIKDAAQGRLHGFFNDVKNLFVGAYAENRSLGAALDVPANWGTKRENTHL